MRERLRKYPAGRLRARVADERGASFLIALMGFIVAMMVIAVIVSAALTTVKQQADDEVTQQRILALQSAAELVVDKTVYSGKANDEYCGFTIVEVETTDASGNVSTTSTGTAFGEFAEELQPALDSFVNAGAAASDYTRGAFSVTAKVDDEDIGSNVSMTLRHGNYSGDDASEKNYQLIYTFKPSYADAGEGYMYATLTARSTSSSKTVADGDKTVKTTTTTWTWGSVVYSTTTDLKKG